MGFPQREEKRAVLSTSLRKPDITYLPSVNNPRAITRHRSVHSMQFL